MIKQDITYQEFKKCIEVITGRDLTTIMKYPSKHNSIEEIVSINGVWYSIGDHNDNTEFSIVKINHECEGRFSIIKSARTFEDCLYIMAEYKDLLNVK